MYLYGSHTIDRTQHTFIVAFALKKGPISSNNEHEEPTMLEHIYDQFTKATALSLCENGETKNMISYYNFS